MTGHTLEAPGHDGIEIFLMFMQLRIKIKLRKLGKYKKHSCNIGLYVMFDCAINNITMNKYIRTLYSLDHNTTVKQPI